MVEAGGDLAVKILLEILRADGFEEATEALACDKDSDGWINLSHRNGLPYTAAAIHEALRIASSPIVPHVAVRDTKIQGNHC